MQRFGEKLRILRKRRGMTLKELARETSYATHSHISEIETGKKKPPLEFALQVGRLFDVSLDRLLKDELEIDGGAIKSRLRKEGIFISSLSSVTLLAHAPDQIGRV